MSDFTCEVVRVGPVTKHPNADKLSCTTVFGQNVIVKTGDLYEGDIAVYIPEDAVVPLSIPAFAFLRRHEGDTTARVRAVRLRGIYSEGLLIPLRDLPTMGMLGADVAPALGIVKYEQPIPSNLRGTELRSRRQARDPGVAPVYSVSHFLKSAESMLQPGDLVVVTEKIHGCNFRAVVKDGRLYVGSHNVFRERPRSASKLRGVWDGIKALFAGHHVGEAYRKGCAAAPADPWWMIADRYQMAERLRAFPGIAIYGEIYGTVQDLRYSVPAEDVVHFAAFDAYNANADRWFPYGELKTFCSALDLPMAPELYLGPYDRDLITPLRSGKSLIDGVTMREGFVIRKAGDTFRDRLKYVSEDYKLRKDGTELH